MNLLKFFQKPTTTTDLDWLKGTMSEKDSVAFIKLVNQYFIKIGEDPNNRIADQVTLKTGDVVNLLSLSKTCAVVPKQNWEKLIEEYLSPLILQLRNLQAYMQKAKIFLNVQNNLRLRIVTQDYDPGAGVSSVVFMDDLLAALYLDAGNVIIGVTEDLISEWGLTVENLHSIAVGNLKNLVELKSGILEKNGIEIKAGFSKDFMASGYLKIIPELLDYKDANSIVFAMPSMDYILFTANPSNAQIDLITQAAKDIYVKASKPITDSLILYKDGNFSYFTQPVLA